VCIVSAVADKLREARALIEPYEQWCQGHSAYDDRGHRTIETDPLARSWCTIGAVSRVYGAHWSLEYCAAINALRRATGQPDLVWWNDQPHRPHAEVLAAFDKAIELAEAGQ
jgi:hypothetical protein